MTDSHYWITQVSILLDLKCFTITFRRVRFEDMMEGQGVVYSLWFIFDDCAPFPTATDIDDDDGRRTAAISIPWTGHGYPTRELGSSLLYLWIQSRTPPSTSTSIWRTGTAGWSSGVNRSVNNRDNSVVDRYRPKQKRQGGWEGRPMVDRTRGTRPPAEVWVRTGCQHIRSPSV